jgi:transcriptional regulator with GAF, ATPase, and Fis domain
LSGVSSATEEDPHTTARGRESALLGVLVELVAALVEDYDVVDVLEDLTGHCVHLLAVDAAGLVVADDRAGLQVMSSSSDDAHALELFQLRAREGPCVDAYRSAAPVAADNIERWADRWPRFVAGARTFGLRGVHALPLRNRTTALGALNLFTTADQVLPAHDVRAAQALADVASTVLLQQRTLDDAHRVSDQLRKALANRVVIEQAKGALSERGRISPDEAFARLRRYARARHLKVTDVAHAVMSDTVDAADLLAS